MKRLLFVFVSISLAGLLLMVSLIFTAAFIDSDDAGCVDDGVVQTAKSVSLLSSEGLTVKSIPMTVPQARNATAIIETARSNKLPAKAAIIGIITAIQESRLLNLPYGYPGSTSLGLFQQIAAWGPVFDRMDPRVSSRMFFLGGQAGQSGLVDIPGWQNMSYGDAAQAVQRSGFPDAYDQHVNEAIAIVAAATEGSGITTVSVDVADACTEEVEYVAATGEAWVFPLKRGSYTFTTNSYGPRLLNGDDYHNGTDFGTSGGTPPLVAMHGGTVLYKGWGGAWGNYYLIETNVAVPGSSNATYKYLYAHLSRFAPDVSEGDTVTAGQYLGDVGDTGNSFGEHLHLTMCIEVSCTSGNAEGSVNPISFLAAVGVKP